jgi:SAM-dependent methyltransferase
MAAAVPAGARVLDVGCAEGYLGAELRRAKGCAVLGVDLHAGEVRGSVTDPAVRAELERRGPYDAAVCGDVLEHLADPAETLRWLRGVAPLLVASLPNAVHWTARRAVLRGRFPHEDHGLFDRTHLRFYDRRGAAALLAGAGWRVVAQHPVPAPLPLQARLPALRRLEAAAARRRPGLFALQTVFEARR